MLAFLTSDVFAKFMGGFILGTIGILTLQPAEARQEAVAIAAVSYHGTL